MFLKMQIDLSKATVPSRLAFAVHIKINNVNPAGAATSLSEAGGPSPYVCAHTRPAYNGRLGRLSGFGGRPCNRSSVTLALSASPRSQEPQQPAGSIVAGGTLENNVEFCGTHKLITNDDSGCSTSEIRLILDVQHVTWCN